MQVNYEQLKKKLEEHYRYGEDWSTRYLHGQRVNYLAGIIGKHLKCAKTALDVGCGGGVYTALLAAKNILTVGIDVSKEALQATRAWVNSEGTSESVQLINCSAEFLPFRKESFDLMVCSEVIEHLDNPRRGIEEISRVLNNEGDIILTVPNVLSYYWARAKIGYEMLRFLKRKGRNIEREKHASFPFWRTLRLLRESNLTDQSISSTNIFPVPFSLMRRLVCHEEIINLLEYLDKQLRKTPFKVLGSSLVVTATKTSVFAANARNSHACERKVPRLQNLIALRKLLLA